MCLQHANRQCWLMSCQARITCQMMSYLWYHVLGISRDSRSQVLASRSPKAGRPEAGQLNIQNQRFKPDTWKVHDMSRQIFPRADLGQKVPLKIRGLFGGFLWI